MYPANLAMHICINNIIADECCMSSCIAQSLALWLCDLDVRTLTRTRESRVDLLIYARTSGSPKEGDAGAVAVICWPGDRPFGIGGGCLPVDVARVMCRPPLPVARHFSRAIPCFANDVCERCAIAYLFWHRWLHVRVCTCTSGNLPLQHWYAQRTWLVEPRDERACRRDCDQCEQLESIVITSSPPHGPITSVTKLASI
jgi:hypothetical protein